MRTGAERQFFGIIAFAGRLTIASASVMWLLGLNLGRTQGVRFTAWTDNPNTLALLLAPTLVILMAEVLSRCPGWLWRSLPFLVTGAFLLTATESRASELWVLVAALGFYAFRQGAALSFGLASVVLTFGSLYWNEITSLIFGAVKRDDLKQAADVLSGRSEIWPLGLKLFGDQPVFGHGIGSSQTILSNYEWLFYESQGHHFHNSYLTIAVETGVMGLIAVGFVLAMSFAGSALRAKRAHGDSWAIWPWRALPWALVAGALAHAFFETWLLSAGNANMILIWTCIILLQERPAGASPSAHRNTLAPGARAAPWEARR
jgi:O-antigen ligase